MLSLKEKIGLFFLDNFSTEQIVLGDLKKKISVYCLK